MARLHPDEAEALEPNEGVLKNLAGQRIEEAGGGGAESGAGGDGCVVVCGGRLACSDRSYHGESPPPGGLPKKLG